MNATRIIDLFSIEKLMVLMSFRLVYLVLNFTFDIIDFMREISV